MAAVGQPCLGQGFLEKQSFLSPLYGKLAMLPCSVELGLSLTGALCVSPQHWKSPCHFPGAGAQLQTKVKKCAFCPATSITANVHPAGNWLKTAPHTEKLLLNQHMTPCSGAKSHQSSSEPTLFLAGEGWDRGSLWAVFSDATSSCHKTSLTQWDSHSWAGGLRNFWETSNKQLCQFIKSTKGTSYLSYSLQTVRRKKESTSSTTIFSCVLYTSQMLNQRSSISLSSSLLESPVLPMLKTTVILQPKPITQFPNTWCVTWKLDSVLTAAA